MQRIIKPKNQKVRRALEDKAPKLIENCKTAMFIRGSRSSQLVTQTLIDLNKLKKPHAVSYKRKNPIRPFEDATSLEFFSQKCDASLFVFGSHNKKRPHNLVFGRLYDGHILDMIEVGIDHYIPLSSFTSIKCDIGAKPCLIFAGDLFETDAEYTRLKNVLIDIFHGVDVNKIVLNGIQHVICVTAIEGKIYFRVYCICLKKSGSKVPRVELEEMGPSLDLVLRRTQLAAPDLLKTALKRPQATKVKSHKNVSVDPFGSKLGHIHMTRQDMSTLQLRKVKGLKRSRDITTTDENEPVKKNKLNV